MNANDLRRPFPVEVVAVGPGSQPDEGEVLDYLPMPSGMVTYASPRLPEPDELGERPGAIGVLRDVLAALTEVSTEGGTRSVDLSGLSDADRLLVNQVLGEGEVSAIIAPGAGEACETRIQEAVFAGVWRVIERRPGGDEAGEVGEVGEASEAASSDALATSSSLAGPVLSDHIEVGPIPAAIIEAARRDGRSRPSPWVGEPPAEAPSAPLLLTELRDRSASWQASDPAHVVNLTLLPVTTADIAFLDHELGTGRVLILSRGYGNCRITDARLPATWRLVYYNSQDVVIQNLVEISEVPEVALAAPEDLADSCERLREVLQWVTSQ